MTHERQQIRAAVIAQLSGKTDAGSRVFSSRVAPIRKVELPAISVYTNDESVDPASASTAPRELTRTLTMAVDGWVAATDAVDDAFDALALQIETAIDSDLEFNNNAYYSVLSSTEFGIQVIGDRPMGCIHMEFTVVYHTDIRVPAVGDTFTTASVEISLDNAQAPADRTDSLFTLET